MTRAWSSLTAILVVEDMAPSRQDLARLGDALTDRALDCEIVIVANGVSAATATALRESAEALCDITVHFLAERVDTDAATLIGMDHGLGDWICILSDVGEDLPELPAVLAAAGPFEIVFASARPRSDVPALYRYAAAAYFTIYASITRTGLDWPAPRIRVYSRAAARYVASRLDAEFQIRRLHVSGAFPGTRLDFVRENPGGLRLPSPLAAVRKGVRGLLHASSLPLRAAIGLAVCGGAFALLTSVYAVLVYVFRDNVAPGWTTLSLQLSAMMFMFALMFGLIAEYVLRLYRAAQPRRRFSIVREVRSPHRRDGGRLNVVGGDGGYRFGAPRASDAIPAAGEAGR